MMDPGRPTRRTGVRSLAIALVALGALVVACAAPDAGPGAPTTIPAPTTTPPSAEPFTVFFVGDSEARMRGNSDAEVAAYVRRLVEFRTTRADYFTHGGGVHRIDPQLVLLGGDISADRSTSVEADLPLWQPLFDAGIPFLAAFGNHDWEPAVWSDGSLGYSVAGHLSNESTTAFTRETYRRSASISPDLDYREVEPAAVHGPVNFHATFRGVDIVNFNTFLYQPSYSYPDGWPLSCNLFAGGAGCQIFASAEPQISRMEGLLRPEARRTALFLQHYPLTTGDSWWGDHGASGTTLAQRKDRLLGLMAKYDHAALLAGHNHNAAQRSHLFAGRTITEYVAPYFGGDGGDDPSRGGAFLALLVSPTDGVLEVRTVPAGG
jgi:hypothetical protein